MSQYLESAILNKLIESPTTELHGLESTMFRYYPDAANFVFKRLNSPNPITPQTIKVLFPSFQVISTDESLADLAEALKVDFLRTRFEKVVVDSLEDNWENDPERAIDTLINELTQLQTRKSLDLMDLTSLERIEIYRQRYEAKKAGKPLGIPSGISKVDQWLNGGFEPGNYHLILGDTGIGKTWLGLFFAVSAWKAGFVPLYVGLEGTFEQLGYRYDTLATGIQNSHLFHGLIEIDDYKYKIEQLGNVPFWLATFGDREIYTPATVWSQAIKVKPDIIIVDYLTEMGLPGKNPNEWQTALQISSMLKNTVALRLNVPVIAIVQGTKASSGASTLDLSNTAISFGINRPADMVLGITQVDYGLKIELLKGRFVKKKQQKPKCYLVVDWDIGDVQEDSQKVL
jgi:KaiC/GvpD/RAD55 family RecA-like ATPase